MSLLSVPAFTRKHIGAFLVPGYATLFGLHEDYAVLGYAEQDSDGLFYIRDDGGPIPSGEISTFGNHPKDMIHTVTQHAKAIYGRIRNADGRPAGEIDYS